MVQRQDFTRPQPDPKGDATARVVFVSVGYALSQWEHAEEVLASLYSFLASPARNSHASFRAYGTLMATRPRRLMIEAAADVFFTNFPDPDLPSRLTALLTIYADAGARRNEIAHGVVMGSSKQTAQNSYDEVFTDWFLVPALHNTNKTSNRLEAEYRFNSITIDRFAESFDKLIADIIDLKQQIVAFYQSLPQTLREQY